MTEEKLGTAFEADEKELIQEVKSLKKYPAILLISVWGIMIFLILDVVLTLCIEHIIHLEIILLVFSMLIFGVLGFIIVTQRLSYLSTVLYLKSKEIKP